jgi:hypothetical protein
VVVLAVGVLEAGLFAVVVPGAGPLDVPEHAATMASKTSEASAISGVRAAMLHERSR